MNMTVFMKDCLDFCLKHANNIIDSSEQQPQEANQAKSKYNIAQGKPITMEHKQNNRYKEVVVGEHKITHRFGYDCVVGGVGGGIAAARILLIRVGLVLLAKLARDGGHLVAAPLADVQVVALL